MMFDHDAIVARALASLRARARAHALGGALMPEKFTMAELQRLYEAVLGRALDRRNFRSKVLELGGGVALFAAVARVRARDGGAVGRPVPARRRERHARPRGATIRDAPAGPP
jgi:hypothetical protein